MKPRSSHVHRHFLCGGSGVRDSKRIAVAFRLADVYMWFLISSFLILMIVYRVELGVSEGMLSAAELNAG